MHIQYMKRSKSPLRFLWHCFYPKRGTKTLFFNKLFFTDILIFYESENTPFYCSFVVRNKWPVKNKHMISEKKLRVDLISEK